MTKKAVDLGDLTITGPNLTVGLDDLVAEITVAWAAEQVAELSILSHDLGGELARTKLGTLGTSITYGGDPWQVAAIDTEFGGDNVEWTFRARSALARKLRRKAAAEAKTNVSPSAWVQSAVKRAGGRAICQPASKAAVIAQAKDQTTLEVIATLASQAGWSWVEHGNTFVFGSRYWAWKTGVPGFPTWAVTWGKDDSTDAFTATATQTEDDAAQFAAIDLTLPHAAGRRLRPWHRLTCTGFGRFDGTWLVDSVTLKPDGVSPVEVTAILPRKPVPQPSSSTAAGVTDASVVPGTSRATVVAYALAQVGKPYVNPASPPNSWDCSKLTAYAWRTVGVNLTAYTYTQVNECNPISESQLLPGDLVFYFRDAHHVSMYIGGGQIVEAASPSSGVRVTSLHNAWNDAHFSSYGRPKGAPVE